MHCCKIKCAKETGIVALIPPLAKEKADQQVGFSRGQTLRIGALKAVLTMHHIG
jgi:hypothetical protein